MRMRHANITWYKNQFARISQFRGFTILPPKINIIEVSSSMNNHFNVIFSHSVQFIGDSVKFTLKG